MSLSRSQQFLVRGSALVIFSAAAIYVFAVPWIQEWMSSSPEEGRIALERMSLSNAILIRVMEVFMASWFFVLGSAIGSFLNVVIYRTPLGISLISERSRCPVCFTDIAGKDNIPILGWIRLNGRCRTCSCEISGRYPFIEFLCGLFFLLFFYVELISGGANIPLRPVNTYTGIVWIIFYTKWDLIIYYLFHMSILSTLLAWAMMQFDGHRIPRRSVVICSCCVLTISLICSWLQPIPIVFPREIPDPFPTTFSGILASVMGLFVGSITGVLVNKIHTFPDHPVPTVVPISVPTDVPAEVASAVPNRVSAGQPAELSCLALCGAAFGWQMVVLCGVSIIAISLLLRTASRGRAEILNQRTAGLQVFAIALLHLIAWRTLADIAH